MEANLNIDVATLDEPHRRALEEVIGRALAENQRLVISITQVEVPPRDAQKPAQTLDDWTRVYDGLSDEEIAEIERSIVRHPGGLSVD